MLETSAVSRFATAVDIPSERIKKNVLWLKVLIKLSATSRAAFGKWK